ncbi:hypothetical protein GCM10028797_20480 [Dyella agri]
MAAPATAPQTLRATLVAGTVAATTEMLVVLPMQVALGATPAQVFQSITSGLTGKAAYFGGLPSALGGAALHLLISLAAAAAYVLAAQRLPLLLRRYVVCGLLYGLVAYVVMNGVVLPLSAIAFKPVTNLPMVALDMVIHMLTFGLPIAICAHRMLRRG